MMLETLSHWTDDIREKHKVTFFEFLYLITIFWDKPWKHLSFSEELKEKVAKRGFTELDEDGKVILTDKGNEIFIPEDGLFDEFIKIYPTRVTDAQGKSRVLSPAKSGSGGAQRLYKDWYAITKNDMKLQRHIIECLKAEITLRKNTGNIFYMRTAESWLEKSTWEDYEYLLKSAEKTDSTTSSRDLRL